MLNRRISSLIGLASISVVLHHAAIEWSPGVLFSHFQADTVLMETMTWVRNTVLVVTRFSVPSFLCVSGMFSVYSDIDGGLRPASRAWKSRLMRLLLPYLFWVSTIFVSEVVVHGRVLHVNELIGSILVGGPRAEYFFVPLLIFFQLIASTLVTIVRKSTGMALIVSGTVQFMTMTAFYWNAFGSPPAIVAAYVGIASYWAFPLAWSFFFVLGIVSSICVDRIRAIVAKYRVAILVATMCSLFCALVEQYSIESYLGEAWRYSVLRIPSSLFALGVLMIFVSSPDIHLPMEKHLGKLSHYSYGILLIHQRIIPVVIRLVDLVNTTSNIAGTGMATALWPAMVMFAFFAVPLGGSILLMWIVPRTRAKPVYHYLFG